MMPDNQPHMMRQEKTLARVLFAEDDSLTSRMLVNLLWDIVGVEVTLATDGAEAVQLAERACAVAGQENYGLLDTLAAAYAEAGRFGDARRTARRARELAAAADAVPEAEEISRRVELYGKQQAYRQPR